jgi:flagellar hook-associated protein 3 FlgL
VSAESRASISKEVAQLRDQILSLSNSKLGDRYVFSGLMTDIQPFNSTTFNYQGDSGAINVIIDKEAVMPINVPGSDTFSYTLSAEDVIQLSDGKYIHYIPGAGTTVNVEVRDTDDTTVLDSFSFSNFIQMTDVLNSALKDNNLLRITALLKPLDNAHNQVINIQADTGARLNRLDDQKTRLYEGNLNLKTALSNTEDADLAEIATELAKTDAAMQALRQSSARLLSQSLLDFLR